MKSRSVANRLAMLPLAIVLIAMQALSQVSPPARPPAGQASPSPATARPGNGAGRPAPPPVGLPVAGMPFVHDPSTVVRFKGRYYVFSTGRGIPFYSSPDGATWTREGSVFARIPDPVHAAVPKNNGMDVWAPDILRVGSQFYLYYAVSSWGSFNSAVALATNPTLDPKDPAYQWTDRGVVVTSDGVEDLNAIDPGVILAPDGTLWICYGSYHGTIDLLQLDPGTGLPIAPKSPPSILANTSEASDIIAHDGFFYLFVNHGSCCKGQNSEYNIRVGRSRAITGPYLDRHGDPLTRGAGSLFLAAHDHRIGPGHFGRLLDYDASPTGAAPDGIERFSLHYEGDMVRAGRSVLDIRPLLWSVDGWPVAGDNLAEGAYQILSRAGENTLQQHIPATPANPADSAPAGAQPAAKVPGTPRLARYLALDNQKWTVAPTTGGSYKIVNLATGDALQVSVGATGDSPPELRPYTDADLQMWHLDQFPDGSYRISNKVTGLALTEAAAGSIAATPFLRNDLHLWTITTP